MNKTEFTTNTQIDISAGGIVKRADWVISQIKSFNIQIPNQNRLQRARDLIDSLNKKQIHIGYHDKNLKNRIAEAHRTIMEQYIVMRGIGIPTLNINDARMKKIEDMLSGADLEIEDKNPLARNTQYELFVGAMLAMGGSAIRIDEPDLKLSYMNEDVPIAVKRIISNTKLVMRIEEARKQIEKQGVMGFMAINYDLFLRNNETKVRKDDSMGKFIESIHSINFKSYYEKLRKNILGIIFIGYKAEWNYSETAPQLDTGYYEYVLFSRDDKNEVSYKKWSQYFEKILKNINEQIKTL